MQLAPVIVLQDRWHDPAHPRPPPCPPRDNFITRKCAPVCYSYDPLAASAVGPASALPCHCPLVTILNGTHYDSPPIFMGPYKINNA